MNKTLPLNVLTAFPNAKKTDVQNLLTLEYEMSERKIIVLDDDPTGVQTVHNIVVYTDWSLASLQRGFSDTRKMFFVLTNSRGLSITKTIQVHQEIISNIIRAAREANCDFIIVSRSDSTLRGHYPLETQTLRDAMENELGIEIHGEILCPAFPEGGRFTIDDTHYVRNRNQLIPAAQTEFAQDPTFGYSKSNLREYIEEKTNGSYQASDVVSIALNDLRETRIDKITRQLMAVQGFGKIIVNAISSYDIKVFCISLYRALRLGKRFCFRTAASFVKELGNISEKPLLKRSDMIDGESGNGGLVVIGSYTKKTTLQLEEMNKLPYIVPLELNSDLVLQEGALEDETEHLAKRCDDLILSGITPAVYTKRTVINLPDDTPDRILMRSVKISHAVQSLVGKLLSRPSFIVAKGGITSSDIGTKALNVKRAIVLGQILPGIPVWRTGEESRFPGLPYIIFPGNVGEETTLREVVEMLTDKIDTYPLS